MMTRKIGLNSVAASIGIFGVLGALAVACSSESKTTSSGAGGTSSTLGKTCDSKALCGKGEVCGNEGTCVEECPGGICIDTDAGTPPPQRLDGGYGDISEDEAQTMKESACVGWNGEVEPSLPVLMFVVDVSTSMKQPDPSKTSRTKWEVTQPALQTAISKLPDGTGVGLLYFPNRPTTPSQVAVASSNCVSTEGSVAIATLSTAQRKALKSSLDTTIPPDNAGTPTHDAYLMALDRIEHTPLKGAKYVVLLTDGQPTYSKDCVGDGLPEHAVDPKPIVKEIEHALGDAVSTFVIGVPGSEKTVKTELDARPWLSQAAEAGGTSIGGACSDAAPPYCHFDMVGKPDFADALSTALAAIADRVVPCDFKLPEPETGQQVDPTQVNVILSSGGTDRLIYRNEDTSCEDGWHFSEDLSRVILCPSSCRLVKRDPKARLVAYFGCTSKPRLLQ